MTVGTLIRQRREVLRISQRELARMAKTSQRSISQFENDDMFSREILIRIAKALDCPNILTYAVRSSVVMRAALEMMGLSHEDKIETFTSSIEESLRELKEAVAAGDMANANKKAERLSNIAHSLTLILPSLGSDLDL